MSPSITSPRAPWHEMPHNGTYIGITAWCGPQIGRSSLCSCLTAPSSPSKHAGIPPVRGAPWKAQLPLEACLLLWSQVLIHKRAHTKRAHPAHQRLAIGQAGSPSLRQDRGGGASGTRTEMVIISTEGNHGAMVGSCCREVASWFLAALLA